ncbi:hypothetical protein ACHAXT_012199 [Thalassiosira profunda]
MPALPALPGASTAGVEGLLALSSQPTNNRAPSKSFSDRLLELQAYKSKHGHLKVANKDDSSLAQFCRNVRSSRGSDKSGTMKLTNERIRALDKLGFDWTAQKRGRSGKPRPKKAFSERLAALQSFKLEHGHMNPQQEDDKSLADFCSSVRQSVKNPGKNGMVMNEQRVAALNAVGFDWRLEEGESQPVPSSFAVAEPSLAEDSKPAAKGTASLSQAPTERKKYMTFAIRLSDLKAYKAKHGHLDVSAHEDASLAQFCANARLSRQNPGRYGLMKLSEKRVRALDEIGFVWRGCGAQGVESGSEAEPTTKSEHKKYKDFSERVEDLKAFKRQHGHLNVSVAHDRSLSQFCSSVRHSRRKEGGSYGLMKLNETRIAALDEIGFVWKGSEGGARAYARDEAVVKREAEEVAAVAAAAAAAVASVPALPPPTLAPAAVKQEEVETETLPLEQLPTSHGFSPPKETAMGDQLSSEIPTLPMPYHMGATSSFGLTQDESLYNLQYTANPLLPNNQSLNLNRVSSGSYDGSGSFHSSVGAGSDAPEDDNEHERILNEMERELGFGGTMPPIEFEI